MNTTDRLCSLALALDYENHDVVHRFTTLYDVEFEEARRLFEDTKRWLWLSSQPDGPALSVFGGLHVLDEMWHNFALFTGDYAWYCKQKLGRFLHHRPETRGQKIHYQKRLAADPHAVRAEDLTKLYRQCAYTQEQLGIEVLIRWYVDYSEKYDEAFFNHKRKPMTLRYTPPRQLRALADGIRAGRRVRVTG